MTLLPMNVPQINPNSVVLTHRIKVISERYLFFPLEAARLHYNIIEFSDGEQYNKEGTYFSNEGHTRLYELVYGKEVGEFGHETSKRYIPPHHLNKYVPFLLDQKRDDKYVSRNYSPYLSDRLLDQIKNKLDPKEAEIVKGRFLSFKNIEETTNYGVKTKVWNKKQQTYVWRKEREIPLTIHIEYLEVREPVLSYLKAIKKEEGFEWLYDLFQKVNATDESYDSQLSKKAKYLIELTRGEDYLLHLRKELQQKIEKRKSQFNSNPVRRIK